RDPRATARPGAARLLHRGRLPLRAPRRAGGGARRRHRPTLRRRLAGREPAEAAPLAAVTGYHDGRGTVTQEHPEQGHLEVERKFDVPAAFVLPDLGAVPGVAAVDPPEERSLEAVYHDTVDLRLLRVPVTLRRRTGGPDAGWHVK